MPPGSERFLDVRSLAGDNPGLAARLRPGMAVLDVGCGSGAITRDIAAAVAPGGEVVGIDLSADLVASAASHGSAHALSFLVADVTALPDGHLGRYDLVSAARVLQWLADPAKALRGMVSAARPGAVVAVLDYDHTAAVWDPALPAAGARFYEAFLAWRSEAGMDNAIGKRLGQMLAEAGLAEVTVADASEAASAGAPDFVTRASLWPTVAATRGHQLVADGVLSEEERAEAERQLFRWAREDGRRQTLRLYFATGVKPGA
jgi:ubiquinone/menaquinone biosynthesis C-methylase UbiE